MQTGKYTGIGLIGNENIAAIYAVNNGIVDINGTGIYHLFYKTYAHDLIQSAVSLIRVKDTIYYGNKVWKKYTHPTHIKPVKTYVEDTYRYCDEFLLSSILMENIVCALKWNWKTLQRKSWRSDATATVRCGTTWKLKQKECRTVPLGSLLAMPIWL